MGFSSIHDHLLKLELKNTDGNLSSAKSNMAVIENSHVIESCLKSLNLFNIYKSKRINLGTFYNEAAPMIDRVIKVLGPCMV